MLNILKKITFIIITLLMTYINASQKLPVLSGVGGNFSAIDMYGKEMQLDDYKGKIIILGFGYTNCPDICPFTLGYLKDLYEQLPKKVQKQVQVMFVTIDPEFDTPKHLKNFIAHFNKDFLGINGKTKKNTDYIVKLFKAKYKKIGKNIPIGDVRAVVVKQQEDKVDLYDHSITLYLIDSDGDTRNISYTGTPKEKFIANILSLLPKSSIKIDLKMQKTAKNARSSVAYGKIINLSNKEDTLLEITSSIANRVELHETKIVDGFAKMIHKANKVFKPKETLVLKPMSYHIMFMGLKKTIDEIDMVDIVLKFKQAGDISLKIKM
jgi:protein SCO1/2